VRRTLLILLASAAALAVLWLLTGGDGAHDRSGRDLAAAPEEAPRPPPPGPGGLVLEEGVARAPAFPEEGETRAKEPHYFYGRAWSDSLHEGVEGCSVLLEADQDHSWGQAPSGPGGFFTVVAPPEALGAVGLRVLVESPAQERGEKEARPGEGAATDLGVIMLEGREQVEGRIEDALGQPVADAHIRARRIGELEAISGAAATAVSDDRGVFVLPNLARGSFAILGEDADGIRYFVAPWLVPAPDALVLRPLPGTSLDVRVENTLDQPVAGARIEAVRRGVDVADDPFHESLFFPPPVRTTDDEGAARVEQLPPGDYVLFCTLPNGVATERVWHQAAAAAVVLRLPTDPWLRLFLFEAPPPPAQASKPYTPLAHTEVTVTLHGESSLPTRTWAQTVTTRTDGDGVARVPRVGTASVTVEATAARVHRAGSGAVAYPAAEGFVNASIAMRPVEAAPPPEEERERPAPRRVRVVTADGLPVAGAVVLLSTGGRSATDDTGVALFTRSFQDSVPSLHRPDLASGNPSADRFGARDLVELTWNEGFEVRLEVSDAVDGFPLSSGVHPSPRGPAWRQPEPGIFVSRWDPAYVRDDERIAVRGLGYETWETAPPLEATTYDVRLRRAQPQTGRLRVETIAGSLFLAGVLVQGRRAADWPADAGRTEFLAVTGLGGAVEVADLAEGPWSLRADGGAHGWGVAPFTVVRGANALVMALNHRPLWQGVVRDDEKRPVAGACVERESGRPVFTDDGGRFFGNTSGAVRSLHVSAPGHVGATVAVRAEPVQVTLNRLGALQLPMEWEDGGGGPPPEDLTWRMELQTRGRGGIRERSLLDVTAHVRDGVVVAEGVPPGLVILYPTGGSAWARPWGLRVEPGKITTSPAVPLRRGGAVEGRVGPRGAGVLVFLRSGSGERVTRTDEEGNFRVTGLPPGTYAIEADGQTEKSRRANERILIEEGPIARIVISLR